jgi:hypothetical protein
MRALGVTKWGDIELGEAPVPDAPEAEGDGEKDEDGDAWGSSANVYEDPYSYPAGVPHLVRFYDPKAK